MSEVVLTDETFKNEVLESDIPVLVDFWAEWCVPCRMLTPLIEQIAQEYHDRLKVAKLNVDECPHTADRYHIQSIPTLAVFKNGKIVAQNLGVIPKNSIVEMFKSLI
jgi:thioredoxin 1